MWAHALVLASGDSDGQLLRQTVTQFVMANVQVCRPCGAVF